MDAAGHAAPLRSTEKATTPFVVGREAIEALRSVVVDGRTVSIGAVRDFREHPALVAFLPKRRVRPLPGPPRAGRNA